MLFFEEEIKYIKDKNNGNNYFNILIYTFKIGLLLLLILNLFFLLFDKLFLNIRKNYFYIKKLYIRV